MITEKTEPSADVVERVAKALSRAHSGFDYLGGTAVAYWETLALAALSAIPQPAEPKPDPWTRLGRWLTDRNAPGRWWEHYESSETGLIRVALWGSGKPTEGEGPTLEAALIAALEQIGA
jgi:hypothetical protein